MKQAVGTSLVIIVINSAAGFSAHLGGFTIDWPIVLSFAIPAILGSLVAGRFADRLKDQHVRTAFAVLVFVVAAWVLITTISSLFSS